MSRCKNCGNRMLTYRDFCTEECMEEYFAERDPEEKISEDDEDEFENT